jgi:hypothetical protein
LQLCQLTQDTLTFALVSNHSEHRKISQVSELPYVVARSDFYCSKIS